MSLSFDGSYSKIYTYYSHTIPCISIHIHTRMQYYIYYSIDPESNLQVRLLPHPYIRARPERRGGDTARQGLAVHRPGG